MNSPNTDLAAQTHLAPPDLAPADLESNDADGDRLPFTVRIDPAGRHVEVCATGEIDLDTATELTTSITEAIGIARVDGRAVRLDLRDVDFIDSTGLRALLAGQAEAGSAGVDLGVDGLSAAARRLLELTDTLERLRRGER